MIRHHVRIYGTNKILAIKLVRELTGCGLREAKDLVEQGQGFFVRVGADTQARVRAEAERSGIEFDPPLDGSVAPPPAELDELDGEGRYGVRYVSGPRLIESIKLVRELTGLGLKDAKQIVDTAGLLRTGIGLDEANAIASRFAGIGAVTEILVGVGSPRERGVAVAADDDDEGDYDF